MENSDQNEQAYQIEKQRQLSDTEVDEMYALAEDCFASGDQESFEYYSRIASSMR